MLSEESNEKGHLLAYPNLTHLFGFRYHEYLERKYSAEYAFNITFTPWEHPRYWFREIYPYFEKTFIQDRKKILIVLQKTRQRKEKHGDRKTTQSNRGSTDSKRRTRTATKRKGDSLNMAYVSLLGDSIIDNKVYVQPHEFSVKEHLEEQSEYMFKQLAVDGHTTSDVLSFQLDKLPKLSTHKVLSIGGNDLLGQIYFLKNKEEFTA